MNEIINNQKVKKPKFQSYIFILQSLFEASNKEIEQLMSAGWLIHQLNSENHLISLLN